MARVALSALAFSLIICVHTAPPIGVVDRKEVKDAYYNQPYNRNGNTAVSNTDPEDYKAILFPEYYANGDFHEANGDNNYEDNDQHDKGIIDRSGVRGTYHNSPYNINGNTAASNIDPGDYKAILVPKYYAYVDLNEKKYDYNNQGNTQYDKGNTTHYGNKPEVKIQGIKGKDQRNENTHMEDTSSSNNINDKAKNNHTVLRTSIKSEFLDQKVNTEIIHDNNDDEKHENHDHNKLTPITRVDKYIAVVEVTVPNIKADQIDLKDGIEIQNCIGYEHNHKNPNYNNECINQGKTRHEDDINRKNIESEDEVTVRNYQHLPVKDKVETYDKDDEYNDKRDKNNQFLINTSNAMHTHTLNSGNENPIHIENNYTDLTIINRKTINNIGLKSENPRNNISDSKRASRNHDNKISTVTNFNSKKGIWVVSPDIDDYGDGEDFIYLEESNSNAESNESSFNYDSDLTLKDNKITEDKNKIIIEDNKITDPKDKINYESTDDKAQDKKDKSNNTNISQRPYWEIINRNQNQSKEIINNLDHTKKHIRPNWEVVASTDNNIAKLTGKRYENNDKPNENKSTNNFYENNYNSRPYWEVIGVKDRNATKSKGYDSTSQIYSKYHHRKYSDRHSHKRHHHSDNRKGIIYKNQINTYNNKNNKDNNDGLIAKTKEVFNRGLKKLKKVLSLTKESENDRKYNSNHQLSADGRNKHKPRRKKYGKFNERYGNNHRKSDNNYNYNNKSGASNNHKYKKYRYSNKNNNHKGSAYNNGSSNYYWKNNGHGESKSSRGVHGHTHCDNNGGNTHNWRNKDGKSEWKHKSDKGNQYYQNNHREYDNRDWKQTSYNRNDGRDGNHQYYNNEDKNRNWWNKDGYGRNDNRKYHNNDGSYKRYDYQADNRRDSRNYNNHYDGKKGK